MASLPSGMDRSIAEEDVIVALYRGILGRTPSDQEIRHHRDALAHADLPSVVAGFVNSPEFSNRPSQGQPGFAPLNFETGQAVETELDPAAVDRIWAHTSQVWRGLGETDALWSVITDDSLRAARNLTPAQVEAFYAGGRAGRHPLHPRLRRARRT